MESDLIRELTRTHRTSAFFDHPGRYRPGHVNRDAASIPWWSLDWV